MNAIPGLNEPPYDAEGVVTRIKENRQRALLGSPPRPIETSQEKEFQFLSQKEAGAEEGAQPPTDILTKATPQKDVRVETKEEIITRITAGRIPATFADENKGSADTGEGDPTGTSPPKIKQKKPAEASIEMMLEKVRTIALPLREQKDSAFVSGLRTRIEEKRSGWFRIPGEKGPGKGIVALSASGLIKEFVSKRKAGWSFDDWKGFVGEVRKKGYGAAEEDISTLVEMEMASFHRNV